MHVRKDLADAFLGQKPTVMRLGGSMTNAPGFLDSPDAARAQVEAVIAAAVAAGVCVLSPRRAPTRVLFFRATSTPKSPRA